MSCPENEAEGLESYTWLETSCQTMLYQSVLYPHEEPITIFSVIWAYFSLIFQGFYPYSSIKNRQLDQNRLPFP